MIRSERLRFLIAYGGIGLLPLLQLKILWAFTSPQIVGKILFLSTFAVVLNALCDGTLSFLVADKRDLSDLRGRLSEVYRVRLARLITFSPLAVLLFVMAGHTLTLSLCVVVLGSAYLLNFSFLHRNTGSVSQAVYSELTLRIACQMFPIIGYFIFSLEYGLLLGCLAALFLQIVVAKRRFALGAGAFYPAFGKVFNSDFLAGLLGMLYATFSQGAAGLLLSAVDFAHFISIDRLVRASLLLAEPVRLWYLRESWKSKLPLSLNRVLVASFAIATVALAAVALVFALDLNLLISDAAMPFRSYVLVSFCISFISFITLCWFIRIKQVRALNWILATGLVLGTACYFAAFGHGAFSATLAFEGCMFFVVLAGSCFVPSRSAKE